MQNVQPTTEGKHNSQPPAYPIEPCGSLGSRETHYRNVKARETHGMEWDN